jgi:hypothetical protein
MRMHAYDHPPLHVHVFRDSEEVAKYDLEHRTFLFVAKGHAARVRAALAAVGWLGSEG